MSGFSQGGNATAFRGVPLLAGTPANGQVYVYNLANNDWELGAGGGGGADPLDTYIVATVGGAHNNANDIAVAVVNGYGTLGARPAAGTAGYTYFASDTAQQYRDNGATWDAETPTIPQTSVTGLAAALALLAPLASPALTGSPTAPTQAAGDNTTKVATDAFVTTAVTNAVAGVNPAVAVAAATAAVLPNAPTYNNGAAGIGATLTTATTNTALVVDTSYTPVLGDRILVKNQASAFQNGVYTVTQIAALGLAWILTRALDYDTPSDINNTGAIPVVNGTVNTTTQWVITSTVNTVGTDALTYVLFSRNPNVALPVANGGTGQTAKQAAFDALSPLATAGDQLVYAAGHNTILSPTLAGQLPFYDGATATVLKVLRAQYDAGVVVTNNAGFVVLQNAQFTIKAPFTVGDKFRISMGYEYLNNTGSPITPGLQLIVGNAPQWVALIPSQTSSSSYRTGYIEVEFTITAVGASGNVVAQGFNLMSAGNAAPIGPLSITQSSFGFQSTNTLDTTADLLVAFYGKPGAGANATFTPIYITMSRIPVL